MADSHRGPSQEILTGEPQETLIGDLQSPHISISLPPLARALSLESICGA